MRIASSMSTTARHNKRVALCILLFCTVVSSVEGLRFRWIASIDRTTGIAASRETSILPASCNLRRAFDSSRAPSKLVEDMFRQYPTWLAGWRVTFGCLRATPVNEEARHKQEIPIRDALFGVTLLSFDGQGKLQRRRVKRQTEYNMVIPIVGGLMTLPTPKGSCGGLSFSLITNTDRDMLTLETSIVGGYRPTIVGPAPVSRFRASVYRSTQSLVHAYIMWRFHHFCYHQSE